LGQKLRNAAMAHLEASNHQLAHIRNQEAKTQLHALATDLPSRKLEQSYYPVDVKTEMLH
jgi:hypothetical protein